MNAYWLLATAIVSEVFGSSMMKASDGFKRLLPGIGMLAGMGTAFYCLSLSLQSIPLGTAYAIWSGVGTALTALIGAVVYRETVSAKKISGLALIVAGVVVMRLAADACRHHADHRRHCAAERFRAFGADTVAIAGLRGRWQFHTHDATFLPIVRLS